MHIYFDSRNAVFQCGPYKPYHSTAATFAFQKELLSQTKYDDENALSEEHTFTKGYTIPLIQLDSLKSIFVVSHQHNSLNKEKLLINPAQTLTQPSRYSVDDFIKDPVLKQFYTVDINTALANYEPGRPEHKPVILEQIEKTEQRRAKQVEEYKLATIVTNFEKQLADKNRMIFELMKRVKELTQEIDQLNKQTNKKEYKE